jgi:hypothetical protein
VPKRFGGNFKYIYSTWHFENSEQKCAPGTRTCAKTQEKRADGGSPLADQDGRLFGGPPLYSPLWPGYGATKIQTKSLKRPFIGAKSTSIISIKYNFYY